MIETITSPKKIRLNNPTFQTGITDYTLIVMDYDGSAITGSPFAMSEVAGMDGVYETAEISFPEIGTYILKAESVIVGVSASVFMEIIVSEIVPSTSEATPVFSVCRIKGHIVDVDGSAMNNIAVNAQYVSIPNIHSSVGVSIGVASAYTDEFGFFSLNLIRGAIVNISIPEIDYNTTVTVPSAASQDLFTL